MSVSTIRQYKVRSYSNYRFYIELVNNITNMSEPNNAPTFWDEHEADTLAFQETQLLNIVSEYSVTMYNKLACQISSLGGEEYIQELITTAHPSRCQEVFRMPLETFLALEKWLTANTSLKESRKHFSVRQKLAIFLFIIGEGASNRAVQEKFQYSGDTVSHIFHEVLNSLIPLHAEIVNLPTKDDVLHPRIGEDTKYFPYFRNCLGALDGTHIPTHVPSLMGAAYRNHKGILSQNVLGVCMFLQVGKNRHIMIKCWRMHFLRRTL